MPDRSAERNHGRALTTKHLYQFTVSAPFSFPEAEERVLAFWKEIDAFHTSVELNKGNTPFSFYDGPPFATGLPHYGHILAGTIKVDSCSFLFPSRVFSLCASIPGHSHTTRELVWIPCRTSIRLGYSRTPRRTRDRQKARYKRQRRRDGDGNSSLQR